MKIITRHISGVHFESTDPEGRIVSLDGSPEIGGQDAGTRPMQLVLMGLAGCSGVDIALILKKKRHDVQNLVIEIEAERSDEVPAVFRKIHVHVKADNVPEKALEQAAGLSVDKYCSVAAMLRSTAKVTWSVAAS